ncbi:MAG: thioredoxin family protein [Deltaproteobacteria bacterium]|nr:thioredoxin family protein [Deltaproteobacteria bacterium]
MARVALGWMLVAGCSVLAGPPPAESVLAAAARDGKSGKRSILVIFHASWCGWCRKLEAVLSVPSVEEILERHYETASLTVQERGEKEALENAGAEELLASIAGKDAGLPFTVVLDRKTRRAIATSNLAGPGTNIGFPSKTDELDAFIAMLRKGAPRMTAAEAETIRAAFPPPK